MPVYPGALPSTGNPLEIAIHGELLRAFEEGPAIDVAMHIAVKQVEQFLGKIRGLFAFHGFHGEDTTKVLPLLKPDGSAADHRCMVLQLYRLISRVGRRRRACWLGIAIFTIAFRMSLSSVLPHPQPASHDEFGYLLGAELFAHGRTAEPPHPLWPFFESVHVIAWPVYAPKYPPAQSAFLAAGLVVFRDPFAGVLLSVALFSATVYWMLCTYLRPAFALLGGVSTSLYFGAGHYWTETYWGGAVAGLGAALLIGAFGRYVRGEGAWGWALGAGGLLLMNSRPYESTVLIASLVALLAGHAFRRRMPPRRLAPVLVSLGLAAALTLGYNYSVTGSPVKLPYLLYMDHYASAPQFWFQPLPEPKVYRNAALRLTAEKCEIANYQEIKAFSAPGRVSQNLLIILVTVLLDGGILTLAPLILLPLFLRDPTARRFAAILGLMLAAVTLEVVMFLHYLAPLIAVAALLSFLLLDRIWRYRKVRGRDRVLLVGCLSALVLAGPLWHAGGAVAGGKWRLYRGEDFGAKRARVAEKILRQPGRHVVLVRFHPQQNPDAPWVANGAELDQARLVWAHDRGGENTQLERYFRGRTFWTLEERAGKVNLAPYSSPTTQLGAIAPGAKPVGYGVNPTDR